MFESNYTCHFFRRWGYEEGRKGIPLEDALLGNMQNDFDAKFGDVCAEIGVRYFIIEFKRNREEFSKEVSPSGKIHRAHLYQHLRHDSYCRSIARQGHFGAYADAKHQLLFEPYAHCPTAAQTKEEILAKQFSAVMPWHELDNQAWISNFNEFYRSIAEVGSDLCDATPGFFEKGLGITMSHLEEYIQCMYQHLESIENDSGESILGAFSPLTGKFVAFNGSIGELVSHLHRFFEEMKSSQACDLNARSSRPHI
ncbi:hypothetical protein [Chromobacterium rhizoryzae]|uniref:hypothetical protein n=1 Tax=Chromobacterium rhizoryzae TaxID=1778675 RepID=UPI001D07E03D|nr:hypothetical protein [Chromobacterium rhizoryzae]